MNNEIESLDNQTSNASTMSHELQECAKFFCNTLANLNKIYEEQIDGLAKIAILLAESAKSDGGNESSAKWKGDELEAVVKQLQNASDVLAQKHTGKQAEIKTDAQSASVNPDAFCNKVEAILINAMENSVSQQQQAYVTGLAILTAGVSKLFSDVPSTVNKQAAQS